MKTKRIMVSVVLCMLFCLVFCTAGAYAQGENVSDFTFMVNGKKASTINEKLEAGVNTVEANATIAAPVGSKLILITAAYDRSVSPACLSDVGYKAVTVTNASDTYTFGSVQADVTTKDILVKAMAWNGDMESVMTPEPICKWDGRALLYTVAINDDAGIEHTALVNTETKTATFYGEGTLNIADLSNVPAKLYRTKGVYTDQKGFETTTLDLSAGQTTISYPVASLMKNYDWTIKVENGFSTYLTEDFTGSEMLDGESKREGSDAVYKDGKWNSTRSYLYTAGNTAGSDTFDLWTAGQWREFDWIGSAVNMERKSNAAGAKPYGTDKPAFNLVMNVENEVDNDYLTFMQTGIDTDDSTVAQNEYLTWMIFKKTAAGKPDIFNISDKIVREVTSMKIRLNSNGASSKLSTRTPDLQIGTVKLSMELTSDGRYNLASQIWNADANKFDLKTQKLTADTWYKIETVQVDNGSTVSYELYIDGNFFCSSEQACSADNKTAATTIMQGCVGCTKIPGYGIKLPVLRTNTFKLSMDDVKIMGVEPAVE